MAYTNTTRVAGYGISGRLNGWIETMKARNAQYRLYRRTLEELSRLTDRELGDLGLHRSQLVEIAREAAYGK
jgi:uncharacterized protein YjiS (DUF1127 family)